MSKLIDAEKFLESEIARCNGCIPMVGSCSMDNVTLKSRLDAMSGVSPKILNPKPEDVLIFTYDTNETDISELVKFLETLKRTFESNIFIALPQNQKLEFYDSEKTKDILLGIIKLCKDTINMSDSEFMSIVKEAVADETVSCNNTEES